jgi:hypothetical protein
MRSAARKAANAEVTRAKARHRLGQREAPQGRISLAADNDMVVRGAAVPPDELRDRGSRQGRKANVASFDHDLLRSASALPPVFARWTSQPIIGFRTIASRGAGTPDAGATFGLDDWRAHMSELEARLHALGFAVPAAPAA